MALSATYKAKLRVFEGSANSMYRDKAGVVTIGVGHALFTANDAVTLPYVFHLYRFRADAPRVTSPITPGLLALDDLGFYGPSFSPLATPSLGIHVDPATPEQVRADWNTVHAKPSGHSVAWYAQYTKCWLADSDVDALFEADLAKHWTTLTNLYPNVSSFPQGAQDALFDLVYNSDFATDGKWPHLKNAVASRDWTTAAGECERGQVQPSRNTYTRQCFLDAATDEAQANRRAADVIDFRAGGQTFIPPLR
jgi:GH24 family phage-related lysozyme (muramidase)